MVKQKLWFFISFIYIYNSISSILYYYRWTCIYVHCLRSRKPIIRIACEYYIKWFGCSAINSCQEISRMWIWLEWKIIRSFPNKSILMNICHPHSSIIINTWRTPCIWFIVHHCRIIQCVSIINIVTSLVYSKIKAIYSWIRH